MTSATDKSLVAMIAEEINKVSAEKVATESVRPESSLWSFDAGSWGLSSLDFLEIVYRLEQRLQIRLPPDLEPAHVLTLGDFAELVERVR
ncbi:acyl carrier protein [Brevibacterium casei]|uniref:acyl carrier protein n=1 Tax=Brevibacterium casei TaxID=33889 RepID=UPI00223B5D58|nr:acyl carrier protein [Brevibacterium casei]MCT1549647.1 acyl carrier protein [Brevibacterium casei]MCT1559184.1 acyl carrier protein [Brevibacterium casei]MCT2207612.1 acyl carrier protein [Brevibacterium casei]